MACGDLNDSLMKKRLRLLDDVIGLCESHDLNDSLMKKRLRRGRGNGTATDLYNDLNDSLMKKRLRP